MGKLQGTSGNSGPHSAPAIVYPVISRRSRGLSVGINLFTERKVCSFDCAYCEVFPFEPGPPFSLESMERELRKLKKVMTGEKGTTKVSPMDVRDIAFSGNGEPTMHPQFLEALSLAGSLRDELFPEAALVLITNGTGLLKPHVFQGLVQAARGVLHLDIWLKLDAGTEGWYRKINRSEIPFSLLLDGIRRFSRVAPFTIQTMLCRVGGEAPGQEESRAWTTLIKDLVEQNRPDQSPRNGQGDGYRHRVGHGAVLGPRRIHLYSKARPSPFDPLAEPLPLSSLEQRAALLKKTLAPLNLPIELFP